MIGSETILKTLDKVQEDSTIKSVVIRINSRGGSALASNIIWHRIQKLKQVKPVIASFSDYAASGGYYIGMGCTKVIANEATITGSIGIFGYWFNLNKLYKQIGISTETIQTNRYADFPSGTRSPSTFERNLLQAHANEGYAEFIKLVSQSRKLSLPKTQLIAAGRVWSGRDAVDRGLIDQVGGLTEAINFAAQEAHLVNGKYALIVMEDEASLKGAFNQLIKLPHAQISMPLGDQLNSVLQTISKFNQMQGVQAHLNTDYIIR